MKSQEENIKVIVRIRPSFSFTDRINNLKDNNSIVLSHKAGKRFNYDFVADENITQECMFNYCKGLFESFIDGYNATIFAYGQTASGKTYSMYGNVDEMGVTHNAGLIPRGLQFIFDTIARNKANETVNYFVKCSFVEIYNEQLYDLLDSEQQKLSVRVYDDQVLIVPLKEMDVADPLNAEKILRRGLRNRHVAATAMNIESSRSHAVFSITLESHRKDGNIDKITRSRLHLVDLAGSEKQRDTKNEGVRLQEAVMINKSLHVLQKVIRSFDNLSKGKSKHNPFRESKLTILLKDAIGGNSRTYLIACVHPSMKYFNDTWSTLQFASRVKIIKNKAHINVDLHGDVASLRKEINELREKLHSPSMMPEVYVKDGYDSFWLKQFVISVILRQNLALEVIELKQQLVLSKEAETILQQSLYEKQREVELKDLKIKCLQRKSFEMDSVQLLINDLLGKLTISDNCFKEQIKSNCLKSEVIHLKTELERLRKLQLKSEAAHVNSILKEYYNLIKTNGLPSNYTAELINESDVDVSHLKEIIADSNVKICMLTNENIHLKESSAKTQRILEKQIVSLKSNLKVSTEQRNAAIEDRRKSMIFKQTSFGYSMNGNSNVSNSPSFLDYDKLELNLSDNDMFLENKIEKLEHEVMQLKEIIADHEYQMSNKNKDFDDLKLKLNSQSLLENKCREWQELCEIAEKKLCDMEVRMKHESTNLKLTQERERSEILNKLKEMEDKYDEVVNDNNNLLSEVEMLKVVKLMFDERYSVKTEMVDKSQQANIESSHNFEQTVDEYWINIDRLKHEHEAILMEHSEQMLKCQESESRHVECICLLEDKCNQLQEECFSLNGRIEEMECCYEQKISESKSQFDTEVRRLNQINDDMKVRTDAEIDELRRELEEISVEFEEAHSRLVYLSQARADDKVKFLLPNVSSSPIVVKGQSLQIDKAVTIADVSNEMVIEMERLLQEIGDKNTLIDRVRLVLSSILDSMQLTSSDSMVDDMVLLKEKIDAFIVEISEAVSEKLSIEVSLQEEIAKSEANRVVMATMDNRIQNLAGKLECVDKENKLFANENEKLLNTLPGTLGHTNPKQKIKGISKLKENLSESNADRLKLQSERVLAVKWLRSKNLLREARDAGLYIS